MHQKTIPINRYSFQIEGCKNMSFLKYNVTMSSQYSFVSILNMDFIYRCYIYNGFDNDCQTINGCPGYEYP